MSPVQQTNPTSDNWEIVTNRYVGFIDIMGFKDMVARRTQEYIYKMMQKIIEATSFAEKIPAYGPKKITDDLRIMTYSDSIMIYTKDDSYICLDHFIDAISSLNLVLNINNIKKSLA